jgi:peptide/nickel transport system substrate-binding protein
VRSELVDFLLVSFTGKEKMMSKKANILYLLVILVLILGACQAPESPQPVVETLVMTEVVNASPVETIQVIQVVTPSPEQGRPRTLVICLGLGPESLYAYGTESAMKARIHEAIADGGWKAFETNSFAYQPVLLEKLPSLADDDASLNVVTVREGDRVVDANGDVVTLDPVADPQIMLVPAGGGEAVLYQGGTIDMEQLSVTFRLLTDVLWSDGAPLTASDSVYAFHLLADPDTSQDKFKVERTSSYKAIDDLTTLWTGLPGFKDSQYFTNFFGPAPEHIWGKYSAAELFEAEESHLKPVGWGPYMIDEWIPGESITLNRNPNYFRAREGLPKFDNLIFRIVGENYTANLAGLLSGECDILDLSAVNAEQSQLIFDLQSSGKIKATFTTGTAWEHLDFGIQHVDYDDGYQMGVDRPDFFSDVRTRQAFAMCMDRQAVIDELLFGQSPVINSYLPPQHPLYNQDIEHYEFDVGTGSALLEEIGWLDDDGDPGTPRLAEGVTNVADGTPLEVAYGTSNSNIRPQVAAILQESLAKCGIKTNIQVNSVPEWYADGPEGDLFGRKFDLGEFLWLTAVEPPCDHYLSTLTPGPASEAWISIQDGMERTFGISGWFGNNIPGYVNEEYDAACNTALGSLPGQPEYESAHLEAQRIFAEQLPVVPLYLFVRIAAMRADMCGLIVDPSNNTELWNIEEFDYGEGCEE